MAAPGTWPSLATEAPGAALLRYLSFVSRDQIPVELLARLRPDEDVPELLAALRRYGLVRTSA